MPPVGWSGLCLAQRGSTLGHLACHADAVDHAGNEQADEPCVVIGMLEEITHVRECSGERREQEARSEEHTSELQSHSDLVCRLLLEKKKKSRDDRPNPSILAITP